MAYPRASTAPRRGSPPTRGPSYNPSRRTNTPSRPHHHPYRPAPSRPPAKPGSPPAQFPTNPSKPGKAPTAPSRPQSAPKPGNYGLSGPGRMRLFRYGLGLGAALAALELLEWYYGWGTPQPGGPPSYFPGWNEDFTCATLALGPPGWAIGPVNAIGFGTCGVVPGSPNSYTPYNGGDTVSPVVRVHSGIPRQWWNLGRWSRPVGSTIPLPAFTYPPVAPPSIPAPGAYPEIPPYVAPWIDPLALPPLVPLPPPVPPPYRQIPNRRPNPDRSPREQPTRGPSPNAPKRPVRPRPPPWEDPGIEYDIPGLPGPAPNPGGAPKPEPGSPPNPNPGTGGKPGQPPANKPGWKPKPHPRRPPRPPTRERKVVLTPHNASAAGRFLNAVFESLELIDIFFDALPEHLKKGMWNKNPLEKLAHILANWDQIRPGTLAANLIANYIEDAAFGKLGEIGAGAQQNVWNQGYGNVRPGLGEGFRPRAPSTGVDPYVEALDNWLAENVLSW